MALSRVKTWISGEVLTASDLNSEFNNILNNAISLISPITGTLDLDGNTLILDAAQATSVVSSAAVSWNFTSGAKTGTPATTGSIANYSAQTFTDNATASSGTAAAWTGFAIQRPTVAANNSSVTVTDAATVYVANSPAAGTNVTITNAWGIYSVGSVRIDGSLRLNGLTATRVPFATTNGVITDDSGFTFNTTGGILTVGAINVAGTTAPTTGWYTPSADLLRTPNSVTIDDALTVTGNATLSGLSYLDQIQETATVDTASASQDLDLSTTNNFHYTLAANTTFTISNAAASGRAHSFTVILTQNGTGNFTAAWPASVKWPGAVTPTVTTTASKTDIFTFVTTDSGTTWFGMTAAQNL